MSDKEPLVFGDPEQPLSIGVFVRSLEDYFHPHDQLERSNKDAICAIQTTLRGNGTESGGMECKVNEMWKTSQKVDTVLQLGKWIWGSILSLTALIAAAVAIGQNLNWW